MEPKIRFYNQITDPFGSLPLDLLSWGLASWDVARVEAAIDFDPATGETVPVLKVYLEM